MKNTSVRVPMTQEQKARYYKLADAEGIPLANLIRVLLDRRIEDRKKGIAA